MCTAWDSVPHHTTWSGPGKNQGKAGRNQGSHRRKQRRASSHCSEGTKNNRAVQAVPFFSDPKTISYGEAVKIIGLPAINQAINSALPSGVAHLGNVTKQDAKAHPGKYVAAGAAVASGGSSLYGLAAAAAVLRVISAGAALWESLTHWH
jgi:hypothetical protein